MKPRLLLIVTTDPRISPRPAEAVRIAAGVGAWQKIDVTLYLRDAAVLALGELAEELVDGEKFTQYLPLVAEWGRPLYVQRGAPALTELGEARMTFQTIDDTQLAELAAASHYVVRF